MKLTLTVTASQPGNAPRGTSRTVEGGKITIGRGADCDWILPDPNNHLSKRHCVVAAQGAGFVITDTSRNGVFLNEAGEPLGDGKSAALQDGDRLALGDYVLESRIAANEPVAERRSAPVNEEDDPFGIADLLVSRSRPPAPPAPPPPSQVDSPFEPMPPATFGNAGPLIPEGTSWLEDDRRSDFAAPARQIPDSGLATSDHTPGVQAAYVPPRIEGSGIPDDWARENSAPPRPTPMPQTPPPGELLAAFLSGAGLRSDALRGQDPGAVMRAAGKAYRAAILGLVEILRTRKLIKSEFRIEQTRIGAVGNNPLKFLDDPDAILAAMIGAPAPGFQEAGAALGDGIRDLKAHQLAMVAAIQTALARLLEQFDPDALKSRLESRSLLDAVLPGARKARYWEVFEQSYKSIAAELEEDFNGVFGKAFAEAYEDELRRS